MSRPLVDHLVEAVVGGVVGLRHGGLTGRGEQPPCRVSLRRQARLHLVNQLLQSHRRINRANLGEGRETDWGVRV
jgi:hypothetical protein